MSARVPRATYRLQLHAGFTFDGARAVLPYLERLGVSDVYLSPPFQAVAGSTHGYNMVSYEALSAELGGEAGFTSLSGDARARGMGLIVDFVPNHMGIANGENAMWEDVLENGQSSLYADFFDVEWHPLKRSLDGKVLLPVLGDQYGRVLERGELNLVRLGGRVRLKYFERLFPASPRTLAPILERAAQLTGLEEGDWDQMELESIATQARNLPHADTTEEGARLERAREKEVLRRRIRQISDRSEAVAHALDAAIAEWNAPGNIDALDAFIRGQNYRLAYWRVATEEINYRRFFDINDLAAIRMEEPRVFETAHALLFQLIGAGQVSGVRLDHTDGLYDPLGYFLALQEKRAEQTGAQAGDLPLYLLAEKILEPGEHLPDNWPIHGTTGYDFLAQLGGLFVLGDAEEELSGLYRRFTGEDLSFGEIVYRGKSLIMRASLSSEIAVLAERLDRLAESDRRSRDFTLASLRVAIGETIASFPVYRTYLRPDGSREGADNAHIDRAIRTAKRRNRDIGAPIFDFLADVLKLRLPDEELRAAYTDFALKFQQTTGPVTAKGVEDTAFYRYNRLISLNEVGGDPALFGTPLPAFHAETLRRHQHWPGAMLATSTHDTKRGEDTRARISVLSELPAAWSSQLATWSRAARAHTHEVEGERYPDLNDEYLFYQTVLGAWPLDGHLADFPERVVAYLHKAARESKRHTSWTNQDQAYEDALADFARGMLADEDFLKGLRELHGRISPHGAQNGLSQALVKFTAPGVPDTYQGAEAWSQSLVDPDNRRPVDYARLAGWLERFEAAGDRLGLARELLEHYQDGAVKAYASYAALRARRDRPDLFGKGDYQPLDGGEHLIAFARTLGGAAAVTLAPRFTLTLTREEQPWALGGVWGDTALTLPAGEYTNALTGETHTLGEGDRLSVADVLREFPLALLLKS